MKRKILSLALLSGGLILLLWVALKVPYCGWDFHNSLWGPVNLLVHHQTPYTYNAPYGPYPAVWMPTIMGALFPLGFVSCDFASKLWLLVEFLGFVWVIWLIADYKMPPPWTLAVCLAVFFLFPPLRVHVILGQFSLMFVILMMAKVYWPKAERFTPLLLVLGLTKPQLGILIYPGLLLSVWHTRGWRQAAWMVLSTGICTAVLLIPLFLFYPGWISDFIYVTFSNLGQGWGLPTLFVQLPLRLGAPGYILWAVVFISALAVSLWLWYRKDAKTALIISLALTPMVTPYASSWDFTLLLPAFFWLMIKLKSKAARAALLAGMLLLFAVQIGIRWRHDITDGSQFWIPPVMILLYLSSMAVERPGILRGKPRPGLAEPSQPE